MHDKHIDHEERLSLRADKNPGTLIGRAISEDGKASTVVSLDDISKSSYGCNSLLQMVHVKNILTGNDLLLAVPREMTWGEILGVYIKPENYHCGAYRASWQGVDLDRSKTLEGNNIDGAGLAELEALGVDPSEYIPTILLRFEDDYQCM